MVVSKAGEPKASVLHCGVYFALCSILLNAGGALLQHQAVSVQAVYAVFTRSCLKIQKQSSYGGSLEHVGQTSSELLMVKTHSVIRALLDATRCNEADPSSDKFSRKSESHLSKQQHSVDDNKEMPKTANFLGI